MTTYIVLVPDSDEAAWEKATEEDRERLMQGDYAFGALLEERGGRITGGASLAASKESRTLRRGTDGSVSVTAGPYAETVEQLSGFYLVECADLDVLAECVAPMVETHGAVEIRRVDAGGDS